MHLEALGQARRPIPPAGGRGAARAPSIEGGHAHLVHLHEQVSGIRRGASRYSFVTGGGRAGVVSRRPREGGQDTPWWNARKAGVRSRRARSREPSEPGREPLGLVEEARVGAPTWGLRNGPGAGSRGERTEAAPRAGGCSPKARERLEGVLGVADEELVAALAPEHDGDGLPRQLRQQEDRDGGEIRDRLVLVPDQRGSSRATSGGRPSSRGARSEALGDPAARSAARCRFRGLS